MRADAEYSIGQTHASSSCFILLNSSLVILPSPSPSFCSFSRDASKSGLGGGGGIWRGYNIHTIIVHCVIVITAVIIIPGHCSGSHNENLFQHAVLQSMLMTVGIIINTVQSSIALHSSSHLNHQYRIYSQCSQHSLHSPQSGREAR